jgi:hypothetical protein
MHLPVFCQPFNSQNFSTISLHGEQQTGPHALTIQVHRTRPTDSMLTAKVSRREPKVLANKIRQESADFHFALDLLAVDTKTNGSAISKFVFGHSFFSLKAVSGRLSAISQNKS